MALLPLQESSESADVGAAAELGPELFEFIERHALGQVWREHCESSALDQATASWLETLRAQARLTAAHQMLQRTALAAIAERLEAQQIPWFLFKGADLREWLYPDPVLRPVSDIDLFIPPGETSRCIDIFRDLGYAVQLNPATASHEVALYKGHVCIDLHWHLFRPGRARPGLTEWLFDHREEHAGLPGLDATASLLVMLVHPAITKYLLSPTSMLIHQVDQARLIVCGRIDWTELRRASSCFGIRTAAWSSLHALEMLTGIQAPQEFIKRIQPKALRRSYLRHWIDRAWISRWFERRWLVAGLFSLALQDSASDSWRAWRAQRNARSNPPLADLP